MGITMYAVYYVWKTNLWMTILPRMSFNMVKEPELTPRTEARKNRECHIGEWSDQHLEPDEASMPCDHDLLWLRKAKGEVAHFIDAKRVLPGVVDTIMCGCGGNVYAGLSRTRGSLYKTTSAASSAPRFSQPMKTPSSSKMYTRRHCTPTEASASAFALCTPSTCSGAVSTGSSWGS